MRLFAKLWRLIAVVGLLTLTGCATPPYADDRQMQQRNMQSEPGEIAQRWGLLTSLIGNTWVLTYRQGGGMARTASWDVPGAAMRVEHLECNGSRCRRDDFMLFWDPETRSIALHCTWGSNGGGGSKWDCAQPTVRAVALPDGSIKVVYSRFYEIIQKYLTGDEKENTLYYVNGDRTRIGPYWRVRSQQDAAQQVAEWRQLVASKDRESSEFWGNVGMAVVAGSQAYADAARQQQSSRVDLPAYGSPQPRIAPSVPTRPSPTTGSSSRVVTEPAPMPAPPPRAAHVSKAEQSKPALIRTPEAIFVCTTPDARGNFSCDSPVTAGMDSGPRGLSNQRTPEQMVASHRDSCPNPRRLQSATHLVWGCGFGATGNSAQRDRSDGVDVKGRRTYYCHEKETSCRRTSP